MKRAVDRLGEKYIMKHEEEVEVIDIEERYYPSGGKYNAYRVKFIESGYETTSNLNSLRKGLLVDYGKPRLCGVGYTLPPNKEYENLYEMWRRMIRKVYNFDVTGEVRKELALPIHTVSNRWLKLENFIFDVKGLIGYTNTINIYLRKGTEYNLDNISFEKTDDSYSNFIPVIFYKLGYKDIFMSPNLNEAGIYTKSEGDNINVHLKGGKDSIKGYKFFRISKEDFLRIKSDINTVKIKRPNNARFMEERIGEYFKNKEGSEFKLIKHKLDKNGSYYLCRFECTGYEVWVEWGNVISGAIKDYGKVSVYGGGISYRGASTKNPKVYKTWSHMLERTINPNKENDIARKSYFSKGVKVCDRWLIFKNFEEDVKQIPNYDKYINDKNKRNNYSLDKDILGDGKLYSLETCMFASQREQVRAKDVVRPIVAVDISNRKFWFECVTDCAEAFSIQTANIYKVMKKQRNHTKGYTFYRPDPNEPYNPELYDNHLIGKEY